VVEGLTLECDVRSEAGRRPNNEDRVFASRRLAAVADGVGGQAAGEVASGLAVSALAALDARFLERSLDEALTRAVLDANDKIRFVAACRPNWAGMATTLSAVAIDDDCSYVLANIGDSRAYLFRDGVLSLLTRDDSYIQEMIDRGALSVDEARGHPQRSLVLNVLDGEPNRRARITATTAQPFDRILLCSDGLTDFVDDHVLARLLAHGDRQECCDLLVERALAEGSTDNVSLVVADVLPRRDTGDAWCPSLET
jgi:PPM family protein phosphatase